MSRKEITKIIFILKTAYPYAFKDMNEQEVQSMVNLYEEMFKDNTYTDVSNAIKNIINTNEYMPTIATIKSKIYDLKHSKEENNSQLWEKLLNAIRNGSYHSEEEFKKLPNLVKVYVRSPRQLQEMAMMDSDVIHSVVKGQFLKQIEAIKENYKTNEIVGGTEYLIGEEIYKLEEFK